MGRVLKKHSASRKRPNVRSLPLEAWPAADRAAWLAAIEPGVRLKRGGKASHMLPVTQNDLSRRYGYLLDFCKRRGILDMAAPAAGHVTSTVIGEFLAELSERVGSVTVYGTIHKVRRAAEIINPQVDFGWLKELENDLDRVKRPRPKHHRLVDADLIVAGGLHVMDEILLIEQPSWHDALRYRDGLMIALCAMCPIRLKNIAGLRIGKSIFKANNTWWISLSDNETKEKRPDERQVPEILTDYLDQWCELKAQVLPPSEDALWASRYVGAIGYLRVEKVITRTTHELFGKPVNPHLLRDCAVHYIATQTGDRMGVAVAVLNHRDPRTIEKHYNKGASIKAAQAYQDILLSS